MRPEIAKKLIELNHQFYQSFAEDFSETRGRLQNGVMQVLETLPLKARILDIGCGNGNLAEVLAERNFQGQYAGIDFSEELVKIARARNIPNAIFKQINITSEGWDQELRQENYDFILCFATLHHIPSEALRLQILNKIHGLLVPGGTFIHSNWQFLNSPRLKKRIQAWEQISLEIGDVDEGDYLMDWRRGGNGLRYVHHYSSRELHLLADQSGFEVKGLFISDGEKGNLGIYQIWEKRG